MCQVHRCLLLKIAAREVLGKCLSKNEHTNCLLTLPSLLLLATPPQHAIKGVESLGYTQDEYPKFRTYSFLHGLRGHTSGSKQVNCKYQILQALLF